MEKVYDYKVIVIGAGPGGYETAIKSAQMGWKTACIEAKSFGGVCLNEGCIPTKTMIRTATLFSEIKEAHKYAVEGIDTSAVSVNMQKLQQRKKQVVGTLTGGVQMLLKSNRVDVIQGEASFVDEHTISVADKTYSAEYIVIATGSEAVIPSFIEIKEGTHVLTSREILNLEEIPKDLVIIGGGVIGIEFAYLFSRLGTHVTVLELMEQILPMVDEEISQMVRSQLKKNGVDIVNQASVKCIDGTQVIYEFGGEQKTVEAGTILIAVGRIPRTEGLQAEKIGLDFDRKAIRTNEYLQTNIPHIYAIGDVNGKVMLAHTASHEGFTALAHIAGKQETIQYDQIPSCIYLDPEVACIGLTEKQAREKYSGIKVGRFPMMANGKSLVEGDVTGMVKVIMDNENRILGVHLYGKHVTDMIGEIATVMHMGGSGEDIAGAIHPHPTVSEAVPEAFMAALYGRAINM